MLDYLDIHTVAWSLQLGLLAWLGALILFIVFNVINGRIALDGLLVHDLASGAGQAERMTLVIATLGYAFYYASTALSTPLSAANPSLPDVPEGVLTALFGAHGLYLTGKIIDLRKRGP